MRRIITIAVLAIIYGTSIYGQSLAELREKQAEVTTMKTEAEAKVEALQAEIDALQKEIEISSGWRKGFSGIAGFNLNRANNWAKNANQNGLSSGLNISATGFLINETEKTFWRNTGILNLGWQKLDPDTTVPDNDTGFDRVTDLLNLSSLAGYKLSESFALTGLGELNTSVGNLLSPGTFNLGVGATYTGIDNLVLVVHPLTLHVAFPADDVRGLSSKAFFGSKLRADYSNKFDNGLTWATNFTSFMPYSGEFVDTDGNTISAFEWTWLNTLTFPVYKGIGLGISFGLRKAAFEFDGTQNFYTVGLSYTL